METNNKKEFKAFDKVLVRRESRPNDIVDWRADIFSHIDNDGFYVTIGLGIVTKNDILPYEGHEELVGTTDEPEEVIKLENGDDIICFDSIIDFENSCKLYITKFWRTNEVLFKTINNERYIYAIRFSDFNPNDMEETKKHILCVKNGKLVRYK